MIFRLFPVFIVTSIFRHLRFLSDRPSFSLVSKTEETRSNIVFLILYSTIYYYYGI